MREFVCACEYAYVRVCVCVCEPSNRKVVGLIPSYGRFGVVGVP